MRITENFSLSEFDCKDGSELPTALLPNVLDLADNLQVLRDYLGVPISINSAYRSLDYNRKIGGATNSQHLLAKAADIVVESKTSEEVTNIIKYLISEGKMVQGGLKAYKTFTHYDIRGYKARW
jgi:uncharacterized protein YcbK (DUF882 family)